MGTLWYSALQQKRLLLNLNWTLNLIVPTVWPFPQISAIFFLPLKTIQNYFHKATNEQYDNGNYADVAYKMVLRIKYS